MKVNHPIMLASVKIKMFGSSQCHLNIRCIIRDACVDFSDVNAKSVL